MNKTVRNLVAGVVAGVLVGVGATKAATPDPSEAFCEGWTQGVVDLFGAMTGVWPTQASDVEGIQEACLNNPSDPMGMGKYGRPSVDQLP